MKLRVDGLCFSYPGRDVLHEVDMELAPHRVLAIIGPNGSGKSTFVKCLNRILKPSAGAVWIGEDDASALATREIARRMGYVPQTTPDDADISVLDVVLMGRRPHSSWRAGADDRAKAEEALRLMTLEDLASRSFRHLSGGERQRVLLARALAQEARILLLDEPTASLDIRHQIEVMSTVRWLADSSAVSVVVVAHDLNLAARFADRMALLSDGRIFAAGTAAEVLTPSNISDVYGVDAKVRFEDGHPFVVVTDVSRAEAA